MTHATAELVARTALQRPPGAGRTRVVAVDGPSGSGKTTFAAAVAEALGGLAGPGHVLPMDDLYPGWDGLADAPALLVDAVLAPLSAGRAVTCPRYDWAVGRYGDGATLEPGLPWLVLDGVGSGARPVRPHLAALAWLESDPVTRRHRALSRDGDVFRPHWERWARQERALFAADPVREHADVVLHT